VREALALARVSDPHVLGILDVSTDPHDCYLVTDYCEGGSLADRLRAGRLMVRDVRSLAREASAGLAAIHAAEIIHRDVKPSNILRIEGRWVIGDFGIARLDGDATLTQTGALIGTPDYWAPETARGERATQAVDIYSLGCVLYEALAGRPVFRGDTPLATGLLHVTAETPQLPAETQRADPRLSALVTRMLEKRPADRPTASAINQELSPGVPDDTLQYPEVPTQVMPSPAAATRRFTDQQRPEKRRRPLVTLLVVSVLLVVGSLGAFALIGRGGATSGSAARTRSTPAASPTTSAPPSTRVGSTTRTVPQLEGKSVAAATVELTRRQLKIIVSGTTHSPAPPGSIAAQRPAANSRVASGSVIGVSLSDGPAPTTSAATTPTAKVTKPAKPGKGRGRGNHGHGHDKNQG
jgi:serine/threonine-protein kinase